MKNIILPILIFLLAGLYSCKENAEIPPEINNGGIVMSFDDHYVSEWYEADSRLANYNWKATFCISSYSGLSLNEIQKLQELVDKGHEIAGHGLKHLDAVKTIDSLGAEEYLNMEIYPMTELMEQDRLFVKSFAYPFGSRNEQTDEILLDIFGMLRGVGRGSNYTAAVRNCFFEGSPVVNSFGIDEHTPYFQGLDYNQSILDVLTYARDNNKIIVVYSHKTVESVTDSYQTSFATLDMICNFI
ncbi:MAG: polysaccharide deacetylase family protein, partial [Cyclobacteriaceae bacterium]|nr:polysaccharide deacetylase family protein [Cyclobacteriaceae bacterium]